MPLTFEAIFAHPALTVCVRQIAQSFVDKYGDAPRLASVFATQQRWLLAQLAIAAYLESPERGAPAGVSRARFLDLAVEARIASRNTAHAFAEEMLKYGFALRTEAADRRFRPLAIAPECLAAVDGWIKLHLASLDALDGGGRVARYSETPGALARLQPRIAGGLLRSYQIRTPDRSFSLFTWLNQGGLIMDTLIAGLEDNPGDPGRIRTSIVSTQQLADMFKLSRSHLARKLREAEALGSIGWVGQRGRSTLWISQAFRDEYNTYQATKLAIIDHSFAASGL